MSQSPFVRCYIYIFIFKKFSNFELKASFFFVIFFVFFLLFITINRYLHSNIHNLCGWDKISGTESICCPESVESCLSRTLVTCCLCGKQKKGLPLRKCNLETN